MSKKYPLSFNINLTSQEREEATSFLKKLCEEIALEYHLITSSGLPVVVPNNRLSRAHGRFIPFENKIDISGKMIKASFIEEDFTHLVKVLKHELAHWYLYKTGGNFNDGHEEFEALLVKLDSISSGSTNPKLQLAPAMEQFGFYYDCKCKSCGALLQPLHRPTVNSYHSDCGGDIECFGHILLNSYKKGE